MKLLEDHPLTWGWGQGTVCLNMHDEASEADHDGGRRDHREGVHDDTRTCHTEEIALQGS